MHVSPSMLVFFMGTQKPLVSNRKEETLGGEGEWEEGRREIGQEGQRKVDMREEMKRAKLVICIGAT